MYSLFKKGKKKKKKTPVSQHSRMLQLVAVYFMPVLSHGRLPRVASHQQMFLCHLGIMCRAPQAGPCSLNFWLTCPECTALFWNSIHREWWLICIIHSGVWEQEDLHDFKANYMVTSRAAGTKAEWEKNKPKFNCKLAPWEQRNLANNRI